MKTFITIAALAAGALGTIYLPTGQALDFGKIPVETCLQGCHTNEELFSEVSEAFKESIHARRGMTCNDCHRLTTAHYEDADVDLEPGNMPYPYPWEQPEVCGSCHSNAIIMKQFDAAPDITAEQLYWTSQHGQALARVNQARSEGKISYEEAAKITGKVAVCATCHGEHGVVEISSPRSTVFPQNVAQTCGVCHGDETAINGYAQSLLDGGLQEPYDDEMLKRLSSAYHEYKSEDNVHRIALEDKGMLDAPTCNDCHGNHGATPPGTLGATRVAVICGSCHVQNYSEFNESFKAFLFDNEEDRDCYACHSNHRIHKTSDEMVGMNENAVCYRCHQDEDLGGQETIIAIQQTIAELKTARDDAVAVLDEAENLGMDVEASRAKVADLHTTLLTARGKIHTYDVEPIRETVDSGLKLAAEIKQEGEGALEQLRFRQSGLLASSVVILIFAGLLGMKIRSMEKAKRAKKENDEEEKE